MGTECLNRTQFVICKENDGLVPIVLKRKSLVNVVLRSVSLASLGKKIPPTMLQMVATSSSPIIVVQILNQDFSVTT